MRKNYFLSVILFSVLLLNVQNVVGQKILEWNFNTPTNSTAREVSFKSTLNNARLDSAILTRGTGAPALGGCASGFVGSWVVSADKAAAVTNNAYFEFKLKAKSGCYLYLNNIKANIRIQTYAAKTYQWMYSLDGINFTEIGSPVTPAITEIDVNNGVMQPTIDVSSISALQEVSATQQVTIRLYAWGGTTPGALDVNPTNLNFGLGKSTSTVPSLAIEGAILDKANVLAWQFFGSDGKATACYDTSKDANLELSNLTRGAGAIAGAGSTNSFNSTMIASADKAAAITNNAYFQFTVKPKSDYFVSLTDLDVSLRITDATLSAHIYQFQYSLDGVNFTDIGTPATLTNTNTNGIFQPTIDLASFANLKNVSSATTVTFRLYAWGGTTGAFGFGKSATVDVPVLNVGAIVTNAVATVSSNPKISGWDFNALTGITATALNATSSNTNLNTPVLSRGVGLTAASFTAGYVSTTSVSASKVLATANNEYYQISISPKSLYKVSLSTLKYRYRVLSAGPVNNRWSYSVDGGASFTEIGSADAISTAISGGNDYQLDLSSVIGLQDVKTEVLLRMYVWGATDNTSVSGFGRILASLTSSTTTGAPINSIYLRGVVDLASATSVKTAFNDNDFFSISNANDKVTLNVTKSEAQEASISIVGIDGKLLLTKKLQLVGGMNTIELPIKLSKGIYIANLLTKNGENQTVKFTR